MIRVVRNESKTILCVMVSKYMLSFQTSNNVSQYSLFQTRNYSEEQGISMLEFLIDTIFVSFGGILFQQVVDMPMGTNCAPLLADLFLYSYESEFLQKLVKDKKIHEAIAFYLSIILDLHNFFH